MSHARAKLISIGRRIAIPLLIVVAWYLAARSQPPDSNFPNPADVLAGAVTLVRNGDLILAASVSLGRVLTGFALAALIAVPVGLLMGVSRPVERNMDPIIQSFRMIAPIALVPLAILWFGPRGRAAIFIVTYAAVFPIILNTIMGAKSVDRVFVRAARTMGIGRLTLLRRVLLPGAMPYVYTGIRIAMGLAWASIIAAELTVGFKAVPTSEGGARYGAGGGIGFMMFYLYANSVSTDLITVTIIAVGAIAYGTDRLLLALGRKVLPWASIGRQRIR